MSGVLATQTVVKNIALCSMSSCTYSIAWWVHIWGTICSCFAFIKQENEHCQKNRKAVTYKQVEKNRVPMSLINSSNFLEKKWNLLNAFVGR